MSPEYIKEKVEQWFNIEDMTINRTSRLVHCRYVYFALCRKFTKLSHQSIAEIIGTKHSTSVTGMKKFKRFYRMVFFSEFKEGYLELSERFKASINDENFREKNPNAYNSNFNYDDELLKIKEEYLEKLFVIVDKNTKIVRKYEKRLKIHRNSDALTEVSKLEDADFKEFENLAKVFLKRKAFLPVKSYLK